MDRSRIMLFIDRADSDAYRRFLDYKGYPTQLRSDATSAYTELKEGGALRDMDILIIHKDLGEPTGDYTHTSDGVCEYVREHYPWIRIGVVSGEFPDGRKHVEGMRADFYFNWSDFDSSWLKRQVEKGPLSLEEMEGRVLDVIPLEEYGIIWPEEDDEGKVVDL